MLREILKIAKTGGDPAGRSGEIVGRLDNQMYIVLIDGASYQNVPSTDNAFHRPGELVRIIFSGGQPIILS